MIDLFIYENCPFCWKVRDAAKEMGIEDQLNLIDATKEENAEKLVELGGKQQVPFLVDSEKNVQMYESDDIVEYLRSRFAEERKA